ncbi:hypothetical protein BDV33DRAFT_171862 [Aspergillus novoparasiticus]|uniref:Uncharacterized protein n=1 Tax=Aspergillus novoparasiticus TaxID=986946 RepID=A0A5N6ET11_9EURO|nr:hypothetical protein BDV33DRAFT_171862 [Aspergillus novoparasiticus]
MAPFTGTLVWTYVFEVVAARVSEGFSQILSLRSMNVGDLSSLGYAQSCVYTSIQRGSCIRSTHKLMQMKDGISKALQ